MPKKTTVRAIVENAPKIKVLEMAWWKGKDQQWRPAAEIFQRGNNTVNPWNFFSLGDKSSLHTHPDLKLLKSRTGSGELVNRPNPLIASFDDLRFFAKGKKLGIDRFHIASVDTQGKVTGYASYQPRKGFEQALYGMISRNEHDRQDPSNHRNNVRNHDQLVEQGHLKIKLTPMPGYKYSYIERRFVKASS